MQFYRQNITPHLAEKVNDFSLGKLHNAEERTKLLFFIAEKRKMENSNLLEKGGLDELSSRATSFFNDNSSFDSLEAIANFRDNYTGSGSGIPTVTGELEPVPVSEIETEYDVFNLAVHSYIGSDSLTDFSAAVNSFSEYITGRTSDAVNPDAANWETTTVAENSLLTEAVSIAIDNLAEFKEDPEFLDKLEVAFGEEILIDEAVDAIDSIISGEANASLEIVKIDNLETNAAFASATNTIYLSENFLEQNEANPENVANAILEEWGHYLDSILNDTDSAGDEGEIFVSLVKDFNFDLDALKAENDLTILDIDGNNVAVEQASGSITLPPSWVIFRSVRGSTLAFKRDERLSSFTDVYFFNASTGVTQQSTVRNLDLFNGQFVVYNSIGTTIRNGSVVQRFRPALAYNAPLWTRIR